MALREFEEGMVRVRSLIGSLRVVIVCAQDLDDRSDALGAAVFLTSELSTPLRPRSLVPRRIAHSKIEQMCEKVPRYVQRNKEITQICRQSAQMCGQNILRLTNVLLRCLSHLEYTTVGEFHGVA